MGKRTRSGGVLGQSSQRGITLTELTIVMVLAALVTVGLMTFYLNSQGVWLDGSSQALTQRDATLVVERITRQTRASSSAQIADDPDSLHQSLTLYDSFGSPTAWFFCDTTGRVHSGSPGNPNQGPIAGSEVERLQFERDDKIVHLRRLAMRSSTGEHVELSTSMAFYNR